MGITTNFLIDVLSFTKATNLFETIVGVTVAKPDFQPLAKEVVQECSGLPIAITIAIARVAHALKEESLPAWKDALLQLKRSSQTNIEGMSEKVYSSIKLSYDFLGSEEAKILLLLCSLHEEDANIFIEKLLRYSLVGACLKISTQLKRQET
ncbi:NB-ARC domain containing protein [Trema orientale]|uniref:NB-ARC domain containing protein n=1 Tax=Trema orientale TaxID=63057 RepID=A0A2P5FIP3_TREOI|nr:NB-ARC domain containing protein [Trema orientale]